MGFPDLGEPMSAVEADDRNLAEDRPDRSPLTTYRAAAVAVTPQPGRNWRRREAARQSERTHNPAATGGVEAAAWRYRARPERPAVCARPPAGVRSFVCAPYVTNSHTTEPRKGAFPYA